MKTGLISTSGGSSPFLLKQVDLSARLTGLTYMLKTELKYFNKSDNVLEAKYVFPTDVVSIYHFRAVVDDREVVCKCRPKAEATTTYNEAVSAGHAAFLSTKDEQCEDIFELTIGNAPPKAEVTITLKYVGHLTAENVTENCVTHGRITMTLPQVLNPRYTPETETKREFELCEPSKVVTTALYGITFTGTLNMPHAIDNVNSPKDHFKIQFTSEDHKMAIVDLAELFSPDHDFQLIINLKEKLTSSAVVEKGDGGQTGIQSKSCLMMQFMPDFSPFIGTHELRTEFVFVIDRSGSMSGKRMEYAKKALLLFLKNIPEGCRFQIIGFGSTHAALFPEPVINCKDSQDKAMEYYNAMKADMGGTEVYWALKTALDAPLVGDGWYREIIFITDGDVRNANEVIGLVRSNNQMARVFGVGIGEGASTHLVSGVSNAGRGYAVFLRDESMLLPEVTKMQNIALQPRATNILLQVELKQKMGNGMEKEIEIAMVPRQIPPILPGQFTTAFALFSTENINEITGNFVMHFEIHGQTQAVWFNLNSCMKAGAVVEYEDQALHCLAGKSQIRELTDEYHALGIAGKKDNTTNDVARKKICEQIVDLSCKLNVLSTFTAFIGVDPKKQGMQWLVLWDNFFPMGRFK